MESVAQSLGISIPARSAARITELPFATLMFWPSIVRLISILEGEAGVPRSLRLLLGS